MTKAGERLIGAAREMRGALEDEVMTLDYLGGKWVTAEDYQDAIARAEKAEALLADSVDKAQAWDAVAKANNRTADRSAECADLRTRAEKAEDARDKAIHQLSEISRKLGEAEGKLAASEMAGIVEGWKTRAEKAEAEEKRLRDLVQEMVLSRSDAQGDYRARAEKAEAEAKKLRAALKPFADVAEAYDPPDGDDHDTAWDHRHAPTIGMLRCARAALNQGGDDGARDRAREEGEK